MSDDEVELVGNATAPLPGVEEIKRLLGLRPLPVEGGYYAESYRSPESLPSDYLPARYGGPRSFGTAIYYLLTPDTFSELHRLQTDEVFHFYLGDPVEMLQLSEDGSGRRLHLGQDVLHGMAYLAQTQAPKPGNLCRRARGRIRCFWRPSVGGSLARWRRQRRWAMGGCRGSLVVRDPFLCKTLDVRAAEETNAACGPQRR